jgi:phage-related protein
MGKRKVEVEIIGDASSLQRAMGQASKQSSLFAKSLKAAGAIGAIAAVGRAAQVAFDELLQGEKVAKDTQAVLKSTGGVANVTAGQVDGLAKSISNYSGMDDEAIAKSENLLLTFTKIRNQVGKGNDIFSQATKAAADLSARMGTDLNGAAVQVGKALNDPIKGVTALQRVGVSFSQKQKEQIKRLVEHGDAMKAQKLILRELNTEFGGAARAAGDTLAGGLNRARNALLEAGASMMAVYAPAIVKVSQWTQKYAEWMGTHMPDAYRRMWEAGKQAVAWFKGNLLPTFQAAADRMRAVWRFMGDDIMRVAGTVFRAVVAIVRPALQTVLGVFKAVGALIRGDWSGLWGAVKQTASGALKTVVAVIRGAASSALAAARFVGTMIWQGVKAGVAKLAQLHAELIRLVGSAIKAAASWALGAAADIGRAIGQGILNGVQSMAGAVANAVQNVAQGALNKVKGALHINSPSKVFSREVGAPITEGIAHGIMSRAPMISAAIDKILRKMKGKLSAQSRLSIAELTFGTADDLAALKRVAKVAEKQLRVALRSGKQDKIQEAAGNLKGVRDHLSQLRSDRRDTKLQAAVDMAKLTAGTDDDVRAMRAMERSLVSRLGEATKRKDYAGQSQFAQALVGLRGELTGLLNGAGGDTYVSVAPSSGFDSSDPRQLAASLSWWMRAASVGAVA